MIEIQTKPSIKEIQTQQVDSERTWMIPILSYIQEGKLQENPDKAERTKICSAKFTILKGQLYKRRYALPYLLCLDQQEVDYALGEFTKESTKIIQVQGRW